jgi:hypothetical protein
MQLLVKKETKQTLIRNRNLDLIPQVRTPYFFSLLMLPIQRKLLTVHSKKKLTLLDKCDVFHFLGAANTLSWHLASENSTIANRAYNHTFV